MRTRAGRAILAARLRRVAPTVRLSWTAPLVLPAPASMRRAEDFADGPSGVRAARPTVVVHAVCSPQADRVRVGFVVSKALGSAVRRNSVKRRLRHLAAAQLAGTDPGIDVVVRALPAAAESPAGLRSDFDTGGSALSPG